MHRNAIALPRQCQVGHELPRPSCKALIFDAANCLSNTKFAHGGVPGSGAEGANDDRRSSVDRFRPIGDNAARGLSEFLFIFFYLHEYLPRYSHRSAAHLAFECGNWWIADASQRSPLDSDEKTSLFQLDQEFLEGTLCQTSKTRSIPFIAPCGVGPRCLHASGQASKLSADDLVKRIFVETEIGDKLPQLRVLILELLEPPHLARRQPVVLLLPIEIRA
jgi:hypothetical protein